MAKRWNEETMITFVNLYESEPVLWDLTHEDKKNKTVRNAAVRRIVSGMKIADFSEKDCKLKIKNLRSHYWHEVGKIQSSVASGSGAENPYTPTVTWFPIVDHFLGRFIDQRKLEKTSDGTASVSLNTTCEQIVNSLAEDWVVVNKDTEDICKHFRSSFSRPSTRRRAKRPRIVAERSSPIEATTNLDKFNEATNNAKETEFDLWAKSVAQQLNNMEPRRALQIQLKLQSLLTAERLSDLESSNT